MKGKAEITQTNQADPFAEFVNTYKTLLESINIPQTCYERLFKFFQDFGHFFEEYPLEEVPLREIRIQLLTGEVSFYKQHFDTLKKHPDLICFAGLSGQLDQAQKAFKTLRKEINKLNKKEDYSLNELLTQLDEIEKPLNQYRYNITEEGQEYKKVYAIGDELEAFLEKAPILMGNDKIQLIKQYILTAISRFEKFNRHEARWKVEKVHQVLEQFFNQFGITIQDCDIVEDTLFKMAEINREYQFARFACYGTRISISIDFICEYTNVDHESLERFINLFKSYGDLTAHRSNLTIYGKKTKDDREYPDYLEALEDDEPPSGPYRVSTGKESVRYSFVVDGEIFFDNLYPLFNKTILALHETQPDYFKPYQDNSKHYFERLQKENEKKAGTTTNFSLTFFDRERVQISNQEANESSLSLSNSEI